MKAGRNHPRGTVSLVALCFVIVLGIALSSYLAICTRSMTFSNRSFHSGLSQQLSELGLEEGLRAFNKGDWADWSNGGVSVDWDIATLAASKRAVAAMTFQAGKFGQGVTATVKIRVDNYDANVIGSPYNASTVYRLNDLVGYNGIWYRSVANGHSGNAPANASDSPNLAYWVPAPIPWMWSSDVSYTQYSVVNYNGTWYRCHTALPVTPPYPVPTNTSYWSYIPAISLSWSSGISYPLGTILFDSGTWYYCIQAHTSSGSITSSTVAYWAPVITAAGAAASPGNTASGTPTYAIGDYIYRAGSSTWFRSLLVQTYASGDYSDTTKWTSGSLPYISWAWRSGVTYLFNDLVFYSSSGSGTWYRCKKASASSAPTTAADWENVLTGTNTTSSTGGYGWSSSSINYNLGDVVCYGSAANWYRCIKAHTSSGSVPPTTAAYWTTTPPLSQDWQPNHEYNQYDTVRYKGVWYLGQTSTSNVGRIPTDTSSNYWAAAPTTITPWVSTTYYELDNLVSRSGTWYRCIQPHKNHGPPNTTYWTILKGSGSTYVWSAGTGYSAGQYRSYDGVWYKCLAATTANDGHSPNDTAYWTATWAQPSNTSVTTGPAVIYAEATVTMANNPPIKTQIRATIAPAALFPNAAGSNTTLNFGDGGLVDAYDGTVRSMNTTTGATSTFGYDETSNSPFTSTNHNVGYTATLAATGTGSISLAAKSTTIKGFVAASPASTSPFAPLASFATDALLQNSDLTMTSPDATAIYVDRTRISSSPYVPQFDPLPSGGLTAAFTAANFHKGTALVLSTPTTTIGIPGSTTPLRYYYDTGDLTIGTSTATTLNIVGPVILYINGDLIVTASGSTGVINITSTGSAEIHVGDSLKVDQLGDGIKNLTSDPKKLIIICDTSATTDQIYGDGGYPFYGVIYAPYTTSGNGLNFNNTAPSAAFTAVFGAVSANKIKYDNDGFLHYDTSLRYTTFGGVDQPYSVTEWRELAGTEPATMP